MPLRLQKFLAEAGVASRRASERLILQGQITVNGHPVTELGTRIDPDHDVVAVEGRRLKARRKIYVALHKPTNIVTTRRDEEGRRTVLDLLPAEWSNLYPVGRLDRETEGLLLLTNDGEFCLRVTHPRYGVAKRYVATIEGRVPTEVLPRLIRGVVDHGETLRARRARLLSANNTRSLVDLELTEGRYREVRRLFQAVGFRVLALCRTRVGPIHLGELPPGKWRTLTPSEVAAFPTEAPASRSPNPRPDRRTPRTPPAADRRSTPRGARVSTTKASTTSRFQGQH